MNEWTFRKRLTVGVLALGALFVAVGLWENGGKEWFTAAIGVARCAASFPAC